MFYRPRDGHGLPHDPFKAIVVPRPIGWVSTLDAGGRPNLAPYSFFNGCGDHPPLVMFAQSGRKTRDEGEKDSIANIRATGEFACSVVSIALKDAMNASTAAYPAGVDEFDKAGLTKGQGRAVAVPHVAEAPAVLECRMVKIVDDLPVAREGLLNIVVIGEVIGVHIRDEVLKDGLVDVLAYHPVARMGYMEYTTVENRWEMLRPKV
jgi:flavin reductase (DIM6/NTAB) family NADH-FMN oxidoreductase RutF